MERRKFIAGVGSLAAGGAAALGTGAFSSAEASRDIQVDIVSDQDAYLAMNDTSTYAKVSNGELYLDFTTETNTGDGDGTDNGKGLPANAEMEFTGLFEIQNQGTQGVFVAADADFNNVSRISCPSVWAHNVPSDEQDGTGLSVWIDQNWYNNLDNSFAPRLVKDPRDKDAGSRPPYLAPGETLEVAIQLNTGSDPGTNLGDGTLQVVAVSGQNPANEY